MANAPEGKTAPHRRTLTGAAVLFVLLVTIAAYVGNYHFVYGAGISMRKIPKVSWSLSETLINADEVKGTPALFIRARFPLFTRSMEAWSAQEGADTLTEYQRQRDAQRAKP